MSFGATTVSTFTTSSEEAPKTPTLTNTLATDNGVNLVSSNSNNQQSESPNSKIVPKVNESSKSSLEEDFDQEEKEKMLRLQRMEQRQERAKKKAEIEQRKLLLEFERKQREHEEQMRRVEEKLQLRLLEAELESSSGEVSDKSKGSSDADSDDNSPSDTKSKSVSDGWGEYAENLIVDLPEKGSKSGSFSIQKRPSYVSRLEDIRNQYSSGDEDDYSNPFDMETRIQSTPTSILGRLFASNFSAQPSNVFSQRDNFINPHHPMSPLVSSSQRSLPKLKLREFDGNPLDWPEWSGMFQATVHNSPISRDEKMSHLKTLLTGKAKRAVNGMGFSGAMYDEAWKTLERKFGQPHHIVSSQLAKIQSFSQVRFNDLGALVEFADTVSSFVNILQQFGYSNDLFSSSNLDIAVSKLPLDTKRRWFAFIETPGKAFKAPNLIEFNSWLQEEAQVHERLLQFSPTISKFESAKSNFEKKSDFKRSSKPNESTFSSNDDKDKSEVKCPLDGSNHRIWNCDKFKSMKTDERYSFVK